MMDEKWLKKSDCEKKFEEFITFAYSAYIFIICILHILGI